MFIFFVLPILTILHAFICKWLLRFAVAWHPAFKRKTLQFLLTLLYFTMFFSTYIATFITNGPFKRFIMLVCRTDVGLTIYSFMIVLPIVFIRFIFLRCKNPKIKRFYCQKNLRIVGTTCIVAILAFCVIGRINAGIIRTTNYDVTINKDGNKFKFACAIAGVVFSVVFVILQLIPIPGLDGVHFCWQSYVMLGVWIVLGVVFYLMQRKKIDVPLKEESIEKAEQN